MSQTQAAKRGRPILNDYAKSDTRAVTVNLTHGDILKLDKLAKLENVTRAQLLRDRIISDLL